MRYGRTQSVLIKACAEIHAVSERSVRAWRTARDPRWMKFLAEKAIVGSVENFESDPEPASDNVGVGLEFEIVRAKMECRDLGRRVRSAGATGDIDAEMALNRMLDAKRETLRRLEKDTPGIQSDNRDVLPRIPVEQAFITYCSEIKARLHQLPDRVLSLLPPETGQSIREKILSEIESIQRSAAEIKLPA